MRNYNLTKDIHKIARNLEKYFFSIRQAELSEPSIRLIKHIIARECITQVITQRVFNPKTDPDFQDLLNSINNEFFSENSSASAAQAEKIDDTFEFPPVLSNYQQPLPSSEHSKISQVTETQAVDGDSIPFKVFDRAVFARLVEQSSLDREIRRVIREMNSNDDGIRPLQQVTPGIVEKIVALKAKYPNMLPFLDFVDRHAALSQYYKFKEFYMPPVLLVSRPGLGKTACVKDVAKALAVPFDFVDYATSSAAWILVGVSSVWSSAKTGLIFDQLLKGPCNGMILCDEIDKSRNDEKQATLNVFYRLLERDIMREYQDEYLPQLKLDASRLMFVATANDISTIPEAILSRFHIINIEPPNEQQLRVITHSIYHSIIDTEGFTAFDRQLSPEVVDELLGLSPRQIKVVLKLAFASAAYRNRNTNNENINIEIEDLDFPEVKDQSTQIGFVWH